MFINIHRLMVRMPVAISFSMSILIILNMILNVDPFGIASIPVQEHLPISVSTNKSTFVTLSNSSLQLNGKPFRFAGANIHWLALDDSLNYPSQFRVNDALDSAKEMGLTVIRSHSLGISTGCSQCVEPSLGVFNKTALAHIDYVIKAAHDRGLRLIIPLTDNWHYPTGGKHNFTTWRGITDEQQFYYNAHVISDFKSYISTLLNHVNSYTGIAYKNDPTILAWETGNELQPPLSWTQTISTYLKSIDKSHLVIDGRESIEPNAALLKSVDILSNHYYPKNIALMNADAQAAKKAGKAFIVGEFDWNDANGGDSLVHFLSSMLSNPEVSGGAFWELWSHADQYGYVHHVPKYDLYYPGDSSAMRASVQLLRTFAYKMRNQPIPPASTPGVPVLETVIRNGTSNILIWQGSTFAASYTIERSINGPRGPWVVLCNRCATDLDTPWVDAHIPHGPLWYRVKAYNLSGVSGLPSVAFQAGSTGLRIDNLNNWSGVYQHSNNLKFDTTHVQLLHNDPSHVIRTRVTHEFITWRQENMQSFQAITYFWSYEPVSPFSFYVSRDGKSWTAKTPTVAAIQGTWLEYIYTLQGLSGVNYIKIVWNNTSGHVWNPEVGAVSMLF